MESPKVIANNQPIYEFLDGNMDKNDTLESIYMKLETKINSKMTKQIVSDDLTYYIKMEWKYQQEKHKSSNQLLLETIQKLEKEEMAFRNLALFFGSLNIETVEKMNDAIISYYNEIGEDILDFEKIESIKKNLANERKSLGYTYENLVSWNIKDNMITIK
jgi:hypothetical protein